MGLIRIWAFLPIVFKFTAGPIEIWGLFQGGSLCVDLLTFQISRKIIYHFEDTYSMFQCKSS